MNRRLLQNLALSVVVLCAAEPAVAQVAAPARLDEAKLAGKFESEGGCENPPGGSPFHRVYHFTSDGTWRMVRTIHNDKSCTSPLLTLRLAGTYRLGDDSKVVPGAREAELSFDVLHVTLRNAAVDKMLAGCGTGSWEAGLEKDVSGTGCPSLGFKPLAECSVDHDIAQIKNDVLFPGVRPDPGKGDMCTPARRPASLQPTGAKKVP